MNTTRAFEIFLIVFSVLLFNVISARSTSQSDDYFESNNYPEENITPIIGILAQEVTPLIERKFNTEQNSYTSYIAASYVKFVEGAGGRVIPIWIGKERNYYEDILTKINGVILPGGATYFNNSNGYAEAGKYIFDIAIELNERGIYTPIWGTCLGFELLTYLSAGQVDVRTNCSSTNQASSLEFKEGFEKSRMFGKAPRKLINILENQPVTSNFHMYCLTETNFTAVKLDHDWNVLSVSYDWNGFRYISAIEHKRYPFYGVQFHPEKNLYEFVPKRNITHTWNSILASQYFADFAVNEARKNKNHFANETEEMNQLIYNYQPTYSGIKGSVFVQMYLFGSDENSKTTAASNGKRPTKNSFMLSLTISSIGKKLLWFFL